MVGTLNQSDLEQRVLDAIDRESCLDLISTMVPIGQPVCSSSIDPEYPPACEEDISNFIAGYLKSIGFAVQ
ncbi:MAG: M20 family peptidase, partial [Cyanobacteria bacterium J06555_12]